MSTAWQYVRFSDEQQEEGDSIRRQREAGQAWSKRTGTPLPDSNIFTDHGVSGYTGKHRQGDNKLAEILRMVERGRIQPGDTLLIENIDRLTRELPVAAINLITNVLLKGVILVALEPRETTYTSTSDIPNLLLMMMEVGRANAESARKSKMVGAAWKRKKLDARNGVILGSHLPAWVMNEGNRLVLIPERAAIVRRIFHLSTIGYGSPSISKKLNLEGVPCFGGRGAVGWCRSYLNLILNDRRALGELQPKTGKDNDGAVIPDYYPAVITEAEYQAARMSKRQRGLASGRRSESRINLFTKLLYHARDGDSYLMTTGTSQNPGRASIKYHVLVNRLGGESRERAYSIPYDAFEAALLSCLREINAAEVLGTDRGPDALTVLSTEFTALDIELAEARAFMDGRKFNPIIGERIVFLTDRLEEVGGQLAIARQQARNPLSEVWGETVTLAAALAAASNQEEARLRLRTAIRRIVESIQLLIVRRGRRCLAAVQMWFTGGAQPRNYLILHQPATNSGGRGVKPAVWSCAALPPEMTSGGDLDLRDRKDAARLEQQLLAMPLVTLGLPEK